MSANCVSILIRNWSLTYGARQKVPPLLVRDDLILIVLLVLGNQDYNGDSLQNVFSSTKTLVSICVASLVDQGLISYEDKVVKHWPEFGSLGKEDIRLCDVLRHESGLVNLSEKVMISDLSRDAIKENKIGSKIEKTEMRLPPEKYQTKRAYHSISRGADNGMSCKKSNT